MGPPHRPSRRAGSGRVSRLRTIWNRPAPCTRPASRGRRRCAGLAQAGTRPVNEKRRGTPSLDRIFKFWEGHGDAFPRVSETIALIGSREPFCFRCLWMAPNGAGYIPVAWSACSGWLERAHLVDLSVEGTNDPGNVVPLCPGCHSVMPTFPTRAGYMDAVQWVRNYSRSGLDELWQLVTDGLPEEFTYPGSDWWRREYRRATDFYVREVVGR